jgi:tetratricopeptide (TPR) repeat protein
MRAAQNDPAAMQEQKRRAFAALVDAELGRAPVMVLLEDLHWGDALTVQYLDEALSHPDPRPLFVLALGRPEVRGLLRPRGLGRELQEISLSALTPRASERLVLAVLGEGAAPEVVARLVERSGGNAFYLEELIRAVADGELTLPDTVLAMAQSRIERLPPEARRVLRAASVYGGSFTQEAIAALLQGETNTVARLDVLESRELLVSTTDAPGGAERSYAFRHALLRDAAYAMLTETDRRRAHTLAADWLERLDNPDPGVIAQHLENGGEAARAIPWLVRAATLALGSGALPDATARATRGIALGADGDELGLLRVVEGLARAYGGLPASSAMEEALERLEPGTSLWWTALAISFYDAGTRGRFDRARELAMLAFSREPGDELTGPYAMAVNAVIAGMMFLGQMDAGASFLERLETSASRDASGDPLFFAWLDAATSLRLTHSAQGGVWQLQRALSLARDSAQSMAQSGSRSGEAHALFNESSVALYLGLYERVEHAALEAIELAERSHAAMSGTWARLQLAIAHLHTGRVQSGIELLLSLEGLDLFQSQSRHVFLATAYLKAGRLAEAKQEADEAYAGPPNFLSGQAASVSAQAALALDEPEKALECVDRHPSALPWWTADLLGTKALALRALGRESEALDAATAARSTVLCAAEGIEDAALRASVFGRVPEVVRTLAIAADFGLD